VERDRDRGAGDRGDLGAIGGAGRFGLDSLIEIGASTVVIWELSGTGEQRQRRGLRLIGYAFAALAAYLLVQSTVVLATGYHPRHSVPGIIWTAVTAAVMFALAAGKARTGTALGNPVLQTEGRVTLIDGILATAVLAGLVLNAVLGCGRPTRPPGTCWFSTPPAKYGTSSSPDIDGRYKPELIWLQRADGRARSAGASANDRRNCNLNLDASPPGRPDLPCEPQLRGLRPRILYLDRTPFVLSGRGGEVHVVMASDLANPRLVGEQQGGA
jgi:hypothetical protein